MTKPTAEQVMQLANEYAHCYSFVGDDTMPIKHRELRAAIEALAAPAAPQQAEPAAQIGWADEFGNLFPMGAWKPAQRTHHDSHKTAWRAVYLHAPAAEVQMLRAAARDVCEWADAAQWALGNETGVPAAKLDALRRALEGGE